MDGKRAKRGGRGEAKSCGAITKHTLLLWKVNRQKTRLSRIFKTTFSLGLKRKKTTWVALFFKQQINNDFEDLPLNSHNLHKKGLVLERYIRAERQSCTGGEEKKGMHFKKHMHTVTHTHTHRKRSMLVGRGGGGGVRGMVQSQFETQTAKPPALNMADLVAWARPSHAGLAATLRSPDRRFARTWKDAARHNEEIKAHGRAGFSDDRPWCSLSSNGVSAASKETTETQFPDLFTSLAALAIRIHKYMAHTGLHQEAGSRCAPGYGKNPSNFDTRIKITKQL